MKNIVKTTTKFTVILMMLFFSLNTVQAQMGDYNVLTPLPGTTKSCAGSVCKTDLSTYLPNMFNLMVGIAAGLAFIMITLGGITYATSDALSGKSQGKEWVTNAITGLLVVIGAYVILYTINPQILSFNIGITAPVITPGASVVPGTPMTAAQIADDLAVRGMLATGIRVNNTACLTGGTSGCTNMNGLPINAVLGINELGKVVGNFNVIITGGTEGGHATHGPGKAIVDLSPTARLNAELMPKGTNALPYDGYYVTKTFKGTTAKYTYESLGGNPNGTSSGAHWHVIYY